MKKILIGVTGSIAAYKVAELVRQLKKSGQQVRVVMTRSATEIIPPMTLQVLSQQSVRVDLFDHEAEAKIDHIALARWADCVLIVPATANFMAKMCCGLADDLLSTLCLATDAPIVIVPAMNRLMWLNPATQANVQILRQRGVQLISPSAGEQACGEMGVGRMAEPEEIVAWLAEADFAADEPNISETDKQTQPLTGKRLLITAGPTIERIDPVRFISNDSSGKMGYALAQAARDLGAAVTLVSGKTALPRPRQVSYIGVESAQNMYDAVMDEVGEADWFIATAAVADYRVATPATQKMKKQGDDGLTLTLVQNPDILQSVCALANKPFCIGFAAETENLIAHAKAKRARKGADLMVANDVSNSALGFNSDDNAAVLLGEDFERTFTARPKSVLARELLLAAWQFSQLD